jgi:hypothetical protein
LAHFINGGLILEEEQDFKPIIERRRKKKMYSVTRGGFERG